MSNTEMILGLLVAMAILFAAMMLFFELGRGIAQRRRRLGPQGTEKGLGAVEGAIFGLMGLLIAFTFSGAGERFHASHFGFASSYAAACHVNALITKGILVAKPAKPALYNWPKCFPACAARSLPKFRCSAPFLPDLLRTKVRNRMDASSSIFPPSGSSRHAILSACAS